jgi:hypothetical protein
MSRYVALGSSMAAGPGIRPSADTGCRWMRVAQASREHHAWSERPWTMKPTKFGLPLQGRPAPLHPNAEGMRAVADLVAAHAT